MNTTNATQTQGYLLLFRGKDWDEGLSPEEIQEVMDRFIAWSNGLTQSGKVKGGQALARTGVVVGREGRTVDGPFPETKEAVGGYLLLDVATLEEAVAIARSSPGLAFGVTIEVRPVLDECPVFTRLRERLASSGSLAGPDLRQAA
jgi:hypothetical protein